MAPTQHDLSADPQRDKRLRALHPARVRRRAQRWRWLAAGVSLLVTGGLVVWLAGAHQAALRATADNDAAIGTMLGVGVLCVLSLAVSVVLLGRALWAAIALRLDRTR
jgi:hypothetical protein